MNHTLHTEIFFFDATTDYLPYYKKFTCNLDEKHSVKDLLKIVQERDPSFEYPKQKTLVQINTKLIDARLKIKELVNVFGTHITIDPASTFRAYKDLRFDDRDFMQKYALLEPFCDQEDLKYYRTLYRTYYASETLKYNPNYYGDALFLLALRLLRREDNEHEDAILDIISDSENGLSIYEYDDNSYPSDNITPAIDVIKVMLENRRFINSEQMQPIKELLEKIKERFCSSEEDIDSFSPSMQLLIEYYGIMPEIIEDTDELTFIESHITFETLRNDVQYPFSNFTIAFYAGPLADRSTCNRADALIASVGGIRTSFHAERKACGSTIVTAAPDIAYKKAGNILLDAFDNNVDILIVDSKEALSILNTNISKCEKAVGREVDLQIVTPTQLAAIAVGCSHDKEALGFKKKGSKITFI